MFADINWFNVALNVAIGMFFVSIGWRLGYYRGWQKGMADMKRIKEDW